MTTTIPWVETWRQFVKDNNVKVKRTISPGINKLIRDFDDYADQEEQKFNERLKVKYGSA